MECRSRSYRNLGLSLCLSFVAVSGCGADDSSIEPLEEMPGGELNEGCVPQGLVNPGPDIEATFYLEAGVNLHVEGSAEAWSEDFVRVMAFSNPQTTIPPLEDVHVYLNGCPIPLVGEDGPSLEQRYEAFGSDVPVELVPGANLTLELWGDGAVLSRETQVLPTVLPRLETPVVHDPSADVIVVEWEPVGIEDLGPGASLELHGRNDEGGGWGESDLDDAAGIHELSARGVDWTHLQFGVRLSDGFDVNVRQMVPIEAP